MQMERLAAAGRDAVHVDADHIGPAVGIQDGSGFFHHFAAGGVPDVGVFRLDVAAGQQPAFQSPMKDQQEGVERRMQHQSGAGDVTGHELASREGSGGVVEKLDDELPAFFVIRKLGHKLL